MTSRSRSCIVHFTRPFLLTALEGSQPPGSYIVETDEELIDDLSFPAYRRTAMWLRLPPPSPLAGALDRVVNIDPAEFDAALARDRASTGEDRDDRS